MEVLVQGQAPELTLVGSRLSDEMLAWAMLLEKASVAYRQLGWVSCDAWEAPVCVAGVTVLRRAPWRSTCNPGMDTKDCGGLAADAFFPRFRTPSVLLKCIPRPL